jgi:hypothetical protein
LVEARRVLNLSEESLDVIFSTSQACVMIDMVGALRVEKGARIKERFWLSSLFMIGPLLVGS